MKQWRQSHTLYNSQFENKLFSSWPSKDMCSKMMGLIRTGFKLDDTALKKSPPMVFD